MLTLDGKDYRVHVIYPSRVLSFEIVEGSNSGQSLSYREIRDIGGTRYNYTMNVQPDPAHPEDFDAFFYAISAPVASHMVSMPFGQDVITFEAVVRSGRITDYGYRAGFRRWKDMQISLEAIEPQRKPG